MRRLFKKFVWYLKWTIASPFLIVGNPFTWLIFNIWSFYHQVEWFVSGFIYSSIVCWIMLCIGSRMKPMKDPAMFELPKQTKPLAPPTVALTAKKGSSAPSVASIARQLPRDLQAAMRGPVDRQPEALIFEARHRAKASQPEEASP